jgi:hypothetical protein
MGLLIMPVFGSLCKEGKLFIVYLLMRVELSCVVLYIVFYPPLSM